MDSIHSFLLFQHLILADLSFKYCIILTGNGGSHCAAVPLLMTTMMTAATVSARFVLATLMTKIVLVIFNAIRSPCQTPQLAEIRQ